MKIIKPYARLIAPWEKQLAPWAVAGRELLPTQKQCGIDAMKYIEWCARISHRAEDKQTDESWKRFIQNVVIEHGDWSVVEHVSISVDAVVDRGITHEWVRHRLFSYTQESTRFVNYTKEKDGKLKNPPAFIYPNPEVECEICLSGDTKFSARGRGDWYHAVGNSVEKCKYNWLWMDAIDEAERHYISLIAEGWRPQEARSVFPNALASRIISTANLRVWRHFFIMRTCAEAHPQMRQVTIPLLKEFQETFPILFDDIVPNEKQAIAMRKAQ